MKTVCPVTGAFQYIRPGGARAGRHLRPGVPHGLRGRRLRPARLPGRLPLRLRAGGPGDPPRVAVPRAARREGDALAGDELRATCARSGRAADRASSRPGCEWSRRRTSSSSASRPTRACYHRMMLPAIALGCDWCGLDSPPPRMTLGRGEVAVRRGRARPRRLPDRRHPDPVAGGLARPDPRSCRPAGRRSCTTPTTTCTRSSTDPEVLASDRDAARACATGVICATRVHRRALRAVQPAARSSARTASTSTRTR